VSGVRGEPPGFDPSEILFPGHVLSLDGVWLDVTVRHTESGALTLEPGEAFVQGMSGSPLITATGAAIGVLSTGQGTGAPDRGRGRSIAQASGLMRGFPGWLLGKLA
jgi:hypothetical protein